MQVVGKTTEGDIVFCEGDGFFLPKFPLNIPSGETDVRAFSKKSSHQKTFNDTNYTFVKIDVVSETRRLT